MKGNELERQVKEYITENEKQENIQKDIKELLDLNEKAYKEGREMTHEEFSRYQEIMRKESIQKTLREFFNDFLYIVK
ncbi:MAG: hypothetical protein JXB88_12540 [Spirochaetales bacterium]|nr:hypothetical protein [Spirochaetales bacterium]